MACSYPAGDVKLLADYVFPDLVDGADIGCVACHCRHVGHAGVHVGGAYSVADSLFLLQHRDMRLRVLLAARGGAACVEKETRLIEVFPVTGGVVEPHQSHFGNLVTGHKAQFSFAVAYVAANAVGISDGYVEETPLAGCLPVGYGAFYHVAEIVELMTEILYRSPAFFSGPWVWMRRILRACGV